MSTVKVSRRAKVSDAVTKQQLKNALVSFESRTREVKYFSASATGNLATAGAFLPLTQAIAQGDTVSTRDGNSVNIKDIELIFQFRINASATFGDTIRFIVFSDKFAAGAYPTVANVLTNSTPTSNFDRQVWLTKRFRILHDGLVVLTTKASASEMLVRRVKVPMKNLHVEYFGDTAVEASNGPNAVYVLLISNNGTNVSSYIVDSRVRYFDS